MADGVTEAEFITAFAERYAEITDGSPISDVEIMMFDGDRELGLHMRSDEVGRYHSIREPVRDEPALTQERAGVFAVIMAQWLLRMRLRMLE